MENGQLDFWSRYGSIIIPAAIALVGGYITYVVSLTVYKEKTNALEKNTEEIKRELKELRDKVIVCETCLKERDKLDMSRFFQVKSPVSLTNEGVDLLNDSGGKVFITENFKELYQKVEESTPKTAYDVQELSKTVIKSYTEDDRFNEIKDYAFKEGMNLDTIIMVMGIELRDTVLKKKSWNVSDIDKHDPSHQNTN